MKCCVLSRCHDTAARFMALTKSSDHTTSVLCFFHYHLMYQKHRFYTCQLSCRSTPRSCSTLLHPMPTPRAVMLMSHVSLLLIFLKQVTKLNSPLMWENLESNSWAVMAGWFWIVHMMTQALILLARPPQHPFPPKCWKKYGHLWFQNAFSYLQHTVLTKHLISGGVQNAEIITCLTSTILRGQFLPLQ